MYQKEIPEWTASIRIEMEISIWDTASVCHKCRLCTCTSQWALKFISCWVMDGAPIVLHCSQLVIVDCCQSGQSAVMILMMSVLDNVYSIYFLCVLEKYTKIHPLVYVYINLQICLQFNIQLSVFIFIALYPPWLVHGIKRLDTFHWFLWLSNAICQDSIPTAFPLLFTAYPLVSLCFLLHIHWFPWLSNACPLVSS